MVHSNVYAMCLVVGMGAPFCATLVWCRGRKGAAAKVLPAVILAGAAAIAGARITYLVTRLHTYADQPWPTWIGPDAGFTLTGGLAAAAVVGWLASSRLGQDRWRLADALAPGIGVAIAIARVGCFWNGCCFGGVTRVPWAVRYPIGSPAFLAQAANGQLFLQEQSLPVHPTQLYEAFGALLGAAGAVWLARSPRVAPGTAGLAFAAWFSFLHGLNHGLRSSGSMRPQWTWVLPALDVAMCVAALLLLCDRWTATTAIESPPLENSLP